MNNHQIPGKTNNQTNDRSKEKVFIVFEFSKEGDMKRLVFQTMLIILSLHALYLRLFSPGMCGVP